jgi:hypothetical protein
MKNMELKRELIEKINLLGIRLVTLINLMIHMQISKRMIWIR